MESASAMYGTFWSIVPPLVAILLALITKEVYSSLFIGVLLGALFTANFAPWESFETLFTTMTSSMDLNILIFDVLLGMIIVLMQRSGGTAAYGEWASRHIHSKRQALLATSGLGCLIFVDDYFNCLAVGSVMRPVTDRFKISRAKLAYIIDSTAAPVCIIAPISSWAAAVNSYVPEDGSITGFQLFLSTIPYNLYALLTLLMVFFISYFDIDFGSMLTHERNAANGDLFTSGAEEFQNVTEDSRIKTSGRVVDLALPVLVLIASAVFAMIYTGHLAGEVGIVNCFANCNATLSLIFATMVTLIFMFALYIPRRVVGLHDFMSALPEGAKLMAASILILTFAWTLKGMGDNLGIGTFVRSIVGENARASVFVPAVMFAIALFLAFSTGTSWGTFAILVPIVVEMFNGVDDTMMIIAVSAVLAGAVCGDHVSPISDTTIMSSAGAQSNHLNHVQTQMQYATIVAAITVVGYVIAGVCENWVIPLVVSAVILLAILVGIKKHVSAGAKGSDSAA